MARIFNIKDVLKNLAAKNRLFSCEADFQFALAWEIKERYSKLCKGIDIHLEYAQTREEIEKYTYTDIVVGFPDKTRIPIELKYKTAKFDGYYNGVKYYLKDQIAYNLARYDFVKDISRLEGFVANKQNQAYVGYGIFLTNDHNYWTDFNRKNPPLDSAFRIHEGKELKGKLEWGMGTSVNILKSRPNPIQLHYTYTMHWDDYIFLTPKLKFKYIVVEVRKLPT